MDYWKDLPEPLRKKIQRKLRQFAVKAAKIEYNKRQERNK